MPGPACASLQPRHDIGIHNRCGTLFQYIGERVRTNVAERGIPEGVCQVIEGQIPGLANQHLIHRHLACGLNQGGDAADQATARLAEQACDSGLGEAG